MAAVRKRFPRGELRTVLHGGCEFVVGPAADPGVLFPVSAPGGITVRSR
jgi:hypothetical protein